jgi:protein PhnA
MVAKQGTAVRNIRLDHENAEYIEGKVDGQTIVIITQYVKTIVICWRLVISPLIIIN